MIIQCLKKSFWFIIFAILFLGPLHAAGGGAGVPPPPPPNQITFHPNSPGVQPNKTAAAGPAGANTMVINLATIGTVFKHFIIGGHNIFFPIDGTQPTTQQAALWSCANINDPTITRWYMVIFGCIDPEFVGPGVNLVENGFAPLSAGKLSPEQQIPYRVISFIGFSQIQEKQFWSEFQKIASNPVGRVFLYRLLIEIRRENAGNGCEEGGPNPDPLVDILRNNARCLEIMHGNTSNDWSYIPSEKNRGENPIMFVNFIDEIPSDTLATTTTLAGPAVVNTCHTQEGFPGSIVCALFHEMLHWYQQLRSPERSESEYKKQYSIIANNDLLIDLGYAQPNVPLLESWSHSYVELDEMRVICGARRWGGVHPNQCPYLQGDDLSENAFRCSMGLKMRFGHGGPIPGLTPEVHLAIVRSHDFATICVTSGTPKLGIN